MPCQSSAGRAIVPAVRSWPFSILGRRRRDEPTPPLDHAPAAEFFLGRVYVNTDDTGRVHRAVRDTGTTHPSAAPNRYDVTLADHDLIEAEIRRSDEKWPVISHADVSDFQLFQVHIELFVPSEDTVVPADDLVLLLRGLELDGLTFAAAVYDDGLEAVLAEHHWIPRPSPHG